MGFTRAFWLWDKIAYTFFEVFSWDFVLRVV